MARSFYTGPMASHRPYRGSDVVPYSEVVAGTRQRPRPDASTLERHGGAVRRLRAWITVARATGIILAVIGPGAVVATLARAAFDRDVAREVVQGAVRDGVRAEVADRTAATRARGRAVVTAWNGCPECTLGTRVRDMWDAIVPARASAQAP